MHPVRIMIALVNVNECILIDAGPSRGSNSRATHRIPYLACHKVKAMISNPTGRVTLRLLAAAAAVTLAGGLIVGCAKDGNAAAAGKSAGAPPAPVSVAAVVAREMPVQVPALLGTVEAYSSVTIKSRVAGQLDQGRLSTGPGRQEGCLAVRGGPPALRGEPGGSQGPGPGRPGQSRAGPGQTAAGPAGLGPRSPAGPVRRPLPGAVRLLPVRLRSRPGQRQRSRRPGRGRPGRRGQYPDPARLLHHRGAPGRSDRRPDGPRGQHRQERRHGAGAGQPGPADLRHLLGRREVPAADPPAHGHQHDAAGRGGDDPPDE